MEGQKSDDKPALLTYILIGLGVVFFGVVVYGMYIFYRTGVLCNFLCGRIPISTAPVNASASTAVVQSTVQSVQQEAVRSIHQIPGQGLGKHNLQYSIVDLSDSGAQEQLASLRAISSVSTSSGGGRVPLSVEMPQIPGQALLTTRFHTLDQNTTEAKARGELREKLSKSSNPNSPRNRGALHTSLPSPRTNL